MFHSHTIQPIANASAQCAAQSRGQLAAVGYYFFGYWFSHRRA